VDRSTNCFRASGILKNTSHESCEVFVTVEYNENIPNSIKCTMVPIKDENRSLFHNILGDLNKKPNIQGEIINGPPFYLEYYGFSSTNYEASLNVTLLRLGFFGKTTFSSGKYYLDIKTTKAPSNEARAFFEYDQFGSIKRNIKNEDFINIDSRLGKIFIGTLVDHYVTEIDGKEVNYQFEKSSLGIEKNFSAKINVLKLYKEVEIEIEDILMLLSLINRKFIRWYTIKALFRSTEESDPIKNLSLYKNVITSEETKREPLFILGQLKLGLFNDLLLEYRKSSIKSVIRNSIIYLCSSYDAKYIESSIQSTYSAAEAIINGLSNELGIYEPITKPKLDELHKCLLKTVEEYFKSENINNSDSLNNINSKLFEIYRRPISDRMADIITKYNVNYSDIWHPCDVDTLKKNIKEIFKRRNDVMHNAEIRDINLIYKDLIRLRALCERIILGVIGFNDINKFYIAAYTQLRSLNE